MGVRFWARSITTAIFAVVMLWFHGVLSITYLYGQWSAVEILPLYWDIAVIAMVLWAIYFMVVVVQYGRAGISILQITFLAIVCVSLWSVFYDAHSAGTTDDSFQQDLARYGWVDDSGRYVIQSGTIDYG